VLQSWHDAEECLTREWSPAEVSEALEPLGLAEVPRAHSGDPLRSAPGIAMRLSYAGRLLTFSLVVAMIHVGVLRWIFLPIGG
jgi:hypothetical protein